MHTHLRMLQKYFMIQRMCSRVMAKKIFNKKSILHMKNGGTAKKSCATTSYLACSCPHGHLMGENSVHLPALSGQVRVHIALQGDVGVSVS